MNKVYAIDQSGDKDERATATRCNVVQEMSLLCSQGAIVGQSRQMCSKSRDLTWSSEQSASADC